MCSGPAGGSSLGRQVSGPSTSAVRVRCRNPTKDLENYNPHTDHWTVDYGVGAGLLGNAAVPDRQRIIILRLIHLV